MEHREIERKRGQTEICSQTDREKVLSFIPHRLDVREERKRSSCANFVLKKRDELIL